MRRTRFLRWSLGILGGLVALLLCVAVALTLWLRPAPMGSGALAYNDAVLLPAGPAASPDRERWSLEMAAAEGSGLPPLRALIERPCRDENGPVPALVLLGGLRTGAEALDRVDFPGQAVIAALDFPYDRAAWKTASGLERAKLGSATLPATVEQTAALLHWLRSAPGVNPERVVYVGVSLGAILGPAVLARLQDAGGGVAAGALAYGGADLTLLLDALFSKWVGPGPLRRGAARWAAFIFERYAPERHLPRFAGPLLLIEADDDDILPHGSLAALRAAAPSNSEIRVQDGVHIGGSERQIVQDTVENIRDWLRGLGLLQADEIASAPACPAG